MARRRALSSRPATASTRAREKKQPPTWSELRAGEKTARPVTLGKTHLKAKPLSPSALRELGYAPKKSKAKAAAAVHRLRKPRAKALITPPDYVPQLPAASPPQEPALPSGQPAIRPMRLAAQLFAHRPGTLQIALLLIAMATFALFSYLNWWPQIFSDPETVMLPYFIFRTLLRMLSAYLLVLLFALPIGIIAGLYRRPRQVIMPLLDILQSVPVLGYLPAALFLFTSLIPSLPGFELGYEVAAVFLIFTGMAWAVVFAVISAVRNIPDDLREASNAFGLRGWRFTRHLILPALVPSLITGSILAWGGGWYFLTAAEILSYGAAPHSLPGLGSYLGNAIVKYNNVPAALFGLIVFICVIYTINQMVWKPLSAYARRYRIQGTRASTGESPVPKSLVLSLLQRFVAWLNPLNRIIERAERLLAPRLRPFVAPFTHVPRRKRHIPLPWYKQGTLYGLLFIAVMAAIAYFFSAALTAPLLSLEQSVSTHPEVWQLPQLAAHSFVRILIAYLLALSWTLVAAVLVTRSRLLSEIFFPIFDIGQSTPALALFPFIVLVVIHLLGGGAEAVEVASILLLLTGAQWYLLFNIIGAIRQIPGDILEASRAFGLRDWDFYRHILLPAILPGILLGSIQAWGGAWNASIVSEYITYGHQVLQVPGLGSFLTAHTLASNPDPWVITLAVASMTLVVLLLNALVWKPLFAYAERFKFQS